MRGPDLERVLAAGDQTTWSEKDWAWDSLSMQAMPLGEMPPCGSTEFAGTSAAGTLTDLRSSQPLGAAPLGAVPLGAAPGGCAAAARLPGALAPADGSDHSVGSGHPLMQPACELPDAAGGAEGPFAHAPLGDTGVRCSSPPGVGDGGDGEPRPPEPKLPAAGASSGSTQAKRGGGGGKRKQQGGSGASLCQADGCNKQLLELTFYHKRNKICDVHIKADVFFRGGEQLRFCQRCGHPHPLTEFDAGKHSCRKQLEKHNARRRKRQAAGEGAGGAGAQPAKQKQPPARRRPRGQPAAENEASAPAAARFPPSIKTEPALELLGGLAAPSAGQHAGGQRSPSVEHSPISSSELVSAEEAAVAAAIAASIRSPSADAPADAPEALPLRSPQQQQQQQLSSPGTSAVASAAALPPPPEGPAAAGGGFEAGQRASSPLPFLDFDMGPIQPIPFEELEAHEPGPSLADELGKWLTAHTAPGMGPARHQYQYHLHHLQQQQQQLQQQLQQQQAAAAEAAPPVAAGAGPSYALASSLMQQHLLGPQQHKPPGSQALGAALAPGPQLPAALLGMFPRAWEQASAAPAVAGNHLSAALTAAPAGGFDEAPGAGLLSSISVKLFGCTPAELPTSLRQQLSSWFGTDLASIEAYIRPGCVHLTVQAVLDPATSSGPAAGVAGESSAPRAHGGGAYCSGGASAAAGAGGSQQGADGSGAAGSGQQGGAPGGRTPGSGGTGAVTGRSPAASGCGCVASGRSCGCRADSGGGGGVGGPSDGGSRKRPAEAPACGDEAVRRVVARMLSSGEGLWQLKTMLVQAGAAVALVHGGKLRGTWDVHAAPAGRAVPTVLEVSPQVVLASTGGEVVIRGLNLLQDNCQLLLRHHGAYIQPLAAGCADCTCSASIAQAPSVAGAPASAPPEARGPCCGCCVSKLQTAGIAAPCAEASTPPQPQASASFPPPPAPAPCCCGGDSLVPALEAESRELERRQAQRLLAAPAKVQSVRLQLGPQQLRAGLLHVDALKGSLLAPRGMRLLVVQSPAVARELGALPGGLAAALGDELGIVMEWVGRPGKVEFGLVERTAARLLHWAAGAGLPATVRLLLGVLQSEAGSSTAAAAAAMRRVLAPGAVDPLQLLHMSDQACSAAALHRAARLGCLDGLSLLHKAVQSGCLDTVEMVLAWGEEASCPWRCDLAGPHGLTPLHLAALLRPVAAAQVAELLLGRCAPGPEAWTGACASDGLSPADFAGLAGHAQAALCAAAARRVQLQQQGAGAVQAPQVPAAEQLRPCCAARSQQQARAPAERAPMAEGGMAWADSLQPPTPRLCQCAGDCPCHATPFWCSDASGVGSVAGGVGCCGSKDGTCRCCADSGSREGPAAPPARGCCRGTRA